MATCNDCIHKDVCYLIEHYGRDLCSDDVCDKFLATPVVHGHWIDRGGFGSLNNGFIPKYKCSVCNGILHSKRSYCGDCGAKMDGNEVE